jgi:hypothetical protein
MSERSAVQNPMLRYAEAIGWTYIPPMKPSNSLQACDRKITALEQEAAFLDELFRAMLEELMTGRLSAQPLVSAYI